jgi:hypothetical protein
MKKTQNIAAKLLATAVAIAVLTGTAAAQFMPSISLQGEPKRKLTPEEQEKQDQLDKAYKSATTKIPDQKANDPWASVRQTPAPAPKKKPPAQ